MSQFCTISLLAMKAQLRSKIYKIFFVHLVVVAQHHRHMNESQNEFSALISQQEWIYRMLLRIEQQVLHRISKTTLPSQWAHGIDKKLVENTLSKRYATYMSVEAVMCPGRKSTIVLRSSLMLYLNLQLIRVIAVEKSRLLEEYDAHWTGLIHLMVIERKVNL